MFILELNALKLLLITLTIRLLNILICQVNCKRTLGILVINASQQEYYDVIFSVTLNYVAMM